MQGIRKQFKRRHVVFQSSLAVVFSAVTLGVLTASGVAGSGVLINQDGHLLNNNDVLEDPIKVTVALANQDEYETKIEGTDPRTDLAMLKIETSEPLPTVSLSELPEPTQPPEGAPNVIIFLLDDVVFAQVGSFGGLIETPNIDGLANNGLRYNNFHTTALGSPSRATLLPSLLGYLIYGVLLGTSYLWLKNPEGSTGQTSLAELCMYNTPSSPVDLEREEQGR